MRTFILTNYSMGRAVTTAAPIAYSPEDAVAPADKAGLPSLGLPGSHPQAAAKSRVLGIKEVR